MRRGSGSGDGKNREHRKYECQNLFMRGSSGTACAALQFFFSPAPWSESCRCRKASAAENGVVCLPANFFFFNFWTLINSYRSFQEPATVMKDNYEKLNSCCMRLWYIGTANRPLFYGIVQPKTLLSCGSSLFFLPVVAYSLTTSSARRMHLRFKANPFVQMCGKAYRLHFLNRCEMSCW